MELFEKTLDTSSGDGQLAALLLEQAIEQAQLIDRENEISMWASDLAITLLEERIEKHENIEINNRGA